jgi:hypothetical protein
MGVPGPVRVKNSFSSGVTLHPRPSASEDTMIEKLLGGCR